MSKKNFMKAISLFCVLTICAPLAACGGDKGDGGATVDKTFFDSEEPVVIKKGKKNFTKFTLA